MSYYDRANDVFMKAYGRYDITFDHGKGVYLYEDVYKRQDIFF